MSDINLWALFLANEKLTPRRTGQPMVLVRLCELLAGHGGPRYRPHAARLASRRLVCETAMDAGIDLAGMKYKGKLAMSRGLLDVWNEVYGKRYGSIVGTAGEYEAIRRDTKSAVSARQRYNRR